MGGIDMNQNLATEKQNVEFKENDFPSPVAYTQGSGLWVVFNYSDAYVNKLSAIDRGEKIWFDPENGMGSGTANGTHETINGTVKAQDETVNETIKQNVSQNGTVNGTVNENQIRVLCYIAETSNASAVNMVEDLKISRRTLFRILSFWGSESMSFIEREGSDKTGHYVLTEKGRLYYKEVLQKDNAV